MYEISTFQLLCPAMTVSSLMTVRLYEHFRDGSAHVSTHQVNMADIAAKRAPNCLWQALVCESIRAATFVNHEGDRISSYGFEKEMEGMDETLSGEQKVVRVFDASQVENVKHAETRAVLQIFIDERVREVQLFYWNVREVYSWVKDCIHIVKVSGVVRPTGSSCRTERIFREPRLSMVEEVVEKVGLKVLREKTLVRVADGEECLWKKLLLYHAGCSRYIFSVTFFPVDLSTRTVLFVQKSIGPLKGFVMPSLSEKSQKNFGAESHFGTFHVVHDDASMRASIRGMNVYQYEDVRLCLECFMHDTTSRAVGLTFHNEKGELETRGWIKKV